MLNEKRLKWLENFRLKLEEKKQKEKQKKLNKKKKKKVIKKNKEDNEILKPSIKKKRVGRPKKRGPKKKRIRRKIVKIINPRPVFDFKIISVLNGKQNGYIGTYMNYDDANAKLLELQKLNNDIVFPRKFLNNGNVKTLKDEYLLLEKNRYGDKTNTPIRNEFGKFIPQKIVNNEKWVVRNKIIRLVEETFWVYGYDHKKDRKTCSWIYENLILDKIHNPYDIIRILVYKNKLIIKYDNEPMSMVMCKNKSDSIRLYNFFSEEIRIKKLKQVVCVGAYNVICDARREIERNIMELTGWDKLKIQRSTN